MKKKAIIANWKLNSNIKSISHFFTNFKLNAPVNLNKNIIVIIPPAVYLERVYKYIHDKNIFLGAQNMDLNVEGSFTGDISVAMLKNVGVKYVILGHSERRLLHNENDLVISKKICLAKKFNLIPIICIGENKEEKARNKTQEIIIKQLSYIFEYLGKKVFRNTIIAYEPIWAIGTGMSADPNYVQLIHEFIKNYIQKYDSLASHTLMVQYGGSVNALNAKSFLNKPDIDGLLIGNASLDVKEFLKIINMCNTK
ncbi:triose-phosphate isomerase [Buchnera aphidicola (Melanaphis sacchari)]|uniref:Triosephosphate isomerase n=1 Tax=Buchnera aphidicola (Melanaphis sacchari) TaxID=2173854 RepID=A0A2U8DG52_9GAMM|nr:triose-phosphate isomerase [Buchnera aphidicola]AWH90481.1 triose-phosphate isomerase [Buchnera aphidicola (Melanaphis sacchari)]